MPQPELENETVKKASTGVKPHLRAAAIADVPEIHELLENYARMGNLLPRPYGELYRHLRDFFVVEIDNKITACAALEIFTEDLGEIRSLVVTEPYAGQGLGKQLVYRTIKEARQIGLRRIMALTYVPEFFHKLEFRTVAKESLPEKVWGICVKCYKYNACDETAVLKDIG